MKKIILCSCGKTKHYSDDIYCAECGRKLSKGNAIAQCIKSKCKNIAYELIK